MHQEAGRCFKYVEGVHMIVARHRPLSFGHRLPVQHVVDFNLRPTAGASKQ